MKKFEVNVVGGSLVVNCVTDLSRLELIDEFVFFAAATFTFSGCI